MKSRLSKVYIFTAKSLTLFFALFLIAGKPIALMATSTAGAYEYTTNPETLKPTKAEGIAMIKQIPSTFLFSKNLKIGTSDIEVKWLQILLNSDPATKVKISGTGSAGYETSYFGPATREALNKFQLKYAATILNPIGLTSPTGIVGERTRTALNQALNSFRTPEVANSNPTQNTMTASTSLSAKANYNAVTQAALPLTIVTNRRLADTVTNSNYSVVIMGTGEGKTYDWNLASGSLPYGLNFTPGKTICENSDCYSLAYISGKPTNIGTSTFSIALSSNGKTISKEFLIYVADANSVTFNTSPNQKLLAQPQNIENHAQTLDKSKKDTGTSRSEMLRGAVLGASTANGMGGSSGMRDVFGGNITYVQYCTCDAMIMLYIYDYDLTSVLQLMYIPGVSSLYEQYQVFSSGPLVLGGQQSASITCLVYSGQECDTYGTAQGYIDTQRGVGTSAAF